MRKDKIKSSLVLLQEYVKEVKDSQIEEIIVRTAFGQTFIVDLTSKSSVEEFCEIN